MGNMHENLVTFGRVVFDMIVVQADVLLKSRGGEGDEVNRPTASVYSGPIVTVRMAIVNMTAVLRV